MRESDVPNTPPRFVRLQHLLDLWLRVDLPVEACARAVGRDDKGITTIRGLGFPVGDHPQPKAVDVDVVENWKTEVDRRPSGRLRKAGRSGVGGLRIRIEPQRTSFHSGTDARQIGWLGVSSWTLAQRGVTPPLPPGIGQACGDPRAAGGCDSGR